MAFTLKKIGLFTLGLVISTVLNCEPSPARTLCIPGLGCIDDERIETTFTTFNVYIDNLSSHPIDVTVQSYKQPNTSGRSCVGGGSSCFNGWREGTWHVRSGQQDVFILDDVEGRNIYVSAKATDGSGKYWKFDRDMGASFTRYDIRLAD